MIPEQVVKGGSGAERQDVHHWHADEPVEGRLNQQRGSHGSRGP